jgi:hypothetical protein
LRAGLHLPANSFREQPVGITGDTVDRSIPSRFFTPELTSTYMLSEKIGIGLYYLYGLGLEKEFQALHTHFISLRAHFIRLSLGKQIFFSWNPQVYYLNIDGVDGYYAAESLEDFYMRKFEMIPENFRKEIGHFNIFRLEPFVEGKPTKIPCKRRDF